MPAVRAALLVVLVCLAFAVMPPAAGAVANPLAGRPFAANIDDALTRAVAEEADPAARALLERLAAQPQARWITGLQSLAGIDSYLALAGSQETTPLLVLYALPKRDCGSHSRGNITSRAGYRRFVRGFAERIAGAGAVVVLEPDALTLTWCLTPRQLADREGLIRDATIRLTRAGATVYLDAGHADWVPARVLASRLLRAGVARARGVALNVSYTGWTSAQRRFGLALSRRLAPFLGGGLRAVVDTSRNGRGPAEDWCNAAGRAVGETPRALRADRLIDGYLWIKRPGESDGTCGGGPKAGVLSRTFALDLAATLPPTG